jgi:predicted transcriptional regulator
MLAKQHGISEIARATGLTRQTVLRIRQNPVHAVKQLVAWAS